MNARYALQAQAGFTLLEALIAILIFTLLIPAVAIYMQDGNNAIVEKAAATRMDAIATAAGEYVKDNYAAILPLATPATAAVITLPMLSATGYLPAGFGNRNAWGQTEVAYVTEPVAGDLQVLILTTGGRAHNPARPEFADIMVPSAAAMLGAKGGFVPSGTLAGQPASVAQGAYGGWQIPFAGSNVPNPGAGHLAALLYFDDGQLVDDFLHRNAVPGRPELNRMNVALDMNGNDIDNVNILNANEGRFANRIGTDGKDPNAGLPPGFAGGVHTQDLIADGVAMGQDFYASAKGRWTSQAIHDAADLADGETIAKPICPAGMVQQLMLGISNAAPGGLGDNIQGIQTWKDDLGASWRVHIRLITQSGGVITPPPQYARVLALAKCS